ncbi:MAG: CYTH and CHAD domain-containing protein [Alphaproteobacteria bacterium]|nr:CYTH and CHAD domain-containing protein [Alphaproteobacteria bacterium]MBF0251812.1 CYTH and CHAD domain-containing protein [Alphaproteobacteria bacterium]
MADKTGGEGLEIELKFELDEADARKVLRSPALRALQSGRPRARTLRATYFDTPDFQLFARKLALRVRREGGRHVQCLKASGPSDGGGAGGFSRREWEWTVPGPDLDAALLRADADIRKLMKGVDWRALGPVYGTDIQRHGRTLTLADGAVVACDWDRGVVTAGEAKEPLCELELELETGGVDALLEIGRLVAATVPARLSRRTKAGRGQALFLGGGAGWATAQKLALPKDALGEDVLRAALLEGLHQVMANEDCVLQRCHVEGVHQMRVALRRMRSLISTFRKLLPAGTSEALAVALRDAGAALGPARDWDVFVDETLVVLEEAFPGDPALAELRVRAQRSRDAAYEQARRMIRSQDHARLSMDVLCWAVEGGWRGAAPVTWRGVGLESPARDVARAILAKRHGGLLKAGKSPESLTAMQRHELRISVKKMRYASEFMSSLYVGKAVKRYVGALKALQEDLGRQNDWVTAERLIGELASASKGASAASLDRVRGMVEGWRAHAFQSCDADFLAAWERFRKASPYW